MKKYLYLLLFIPLMTCSDDDDDSLLRITNNTNEDFRITQISFMEVKVAALDIYSMKRDSLINLIKINKP